MTKLQIEGNYFSFSVLEFKKEEALFLEGILEKELVPYDKIFFERKDFKKLGFSTIEELPVVLEVNGFLSSFHTLQHPDNFTFFKNNKKVFVCAVDRLETKYHTGLFKELCHIKSIINPNELNFRRKKGCKYFFLKKVQKGIFTLSLKDDIQLNQLLFVHKVHHIKFKGFYQNPIQLLEVFHDDSKLEFDKNKTEIKKSICAIN
jgi:hypothetical protein